MPREELGGRVYDDICAVLEGAAEVRSRHCVVDDERDPCIRVYTCMSYIIYICVIH